MYEQDEAERFLLERTQVLCSPPRIPWTALPGSQSASAAGSTALVPPALISRDRKANRGTHEPVARPRGFGSGLGPGLDDVFDRASAGDEPDPLRRIPSPEESEEWKRRKLAAARVKRADEYQRMQVRCLGASAGPSAGAEVLDVDALEEEAERRQAAIERRNAEANGWRRASHGAPANGKGKEVVVLDDDEEEEDQDENMEMCVICLQGVRDRTVLGECGHQSFCFACINVWANQSRRCPLCSAAMSAFLLHKIDDPAGPQKFHLPPLPSIRPAQHTTFSSSLATRPAVPPFRTQGEVLLSERERWGRRGGGEANGESSEDALERQLERRRAIYRHELFTKHIASNMHTRYKPIPTPRQFADNPDMVARATSFLRRELRVWRGIDVEFLTAYIISLMRSIDIRSEPAVRLLADFLDEPGLAGRERRGAEHFAHEVYSFLRSPYRDLAVYDAVAQYDPVPEEDSVWAQAKEINDAPELRPSIAGDRAAIQPRSPGRRRSASPMRDRSRSRSRSFSASPRSSFPPSRSPSPRHRDRPPRASPRRWDRRDVYLPASPRGGNNSTAARGDSWVDPEVAAAEAETRRRRDARREKTERRKEARSARRKRALANGKGRDEAGVGGQDGASRRRDEPPHRGLRGWGEAEDAPPEAKMPVEAVGPSASAGEAQVNGGSNVVKPLHLRIFGVAKPAAVSSTHETEGALTSPNLLASASQNGTDAMEDNYAPAMNVDLPRPEDMVIPPPRSPAAISDYEEDPWGVEPDLGDAGFELYAVVPTSASAIGNQEGTMAAAVQPASGEKIARLKALQREKLLGKLVREKRISARARAIVSARSWAANSASLEDRGDARADEDARAGNRSPPRRAAPSAIEPTAQDIDLAGRTRELRLKLKLKLAKDKAQGAPRPAATAPVVTAPVEDRAALLRARLMAAKAAV